MSAWAESMLLWSWQALLLIGLLTIAARIFPFRSARERYGYWLVAIVVIAVLPLANIAVRSVPLVTPVVEPIASVVQLPTPFSSSIESPEQTFATPAESSMPKQVSWSPILRMSLFWMWAAGVLITMFRPCRSYWESRRLRESAHEVEIGAFPVRLGYSPDVQSPMLAGILNPMILLPDDIEDWADPEERQAVVLHELAHLERRDHLVNLFQTLLGAVLFFHPAVRYALRQLLLERELACDERVLAAGARPSAYADALLKVAEHSLARERYQPAFNASGKILDRRMNMILNFRAPISRGSRFLRIARAAAVLSFAALLLPHRPVVFQAQPAATVVALAVETQAAAPAPQTPAPRRDAGTVREFALPPASALLLLQQPTIPPPPPAQVPAVKVSGKISDQTGAVIPGVTVRLSRLSNASASPATTLRLPNNESELRAYLDALAVGSDPKAAITNDSGSYEFPQVNPGTYALTATLPGFTPSSRTLVVQSRDTTNDFILQVAAVNTQVQVSASRPSVPATAAPATPPQQPIRVGGNVSAPNLLTQIKPVYPAAARAQQIQGAVQLLAVISADGQIVSLRLDPSSSTGNLDLVQAAMDAVRQWRYRPATLNGVPIEVATTINISFLLSD